MQLVHRDSLAATLDAVNEAFFDRREPSQAQRRAAAQWIAARQGLCGSYRQMFAPTEGDFAAGVRLFTGETLRSRAGSAHVLGQEACRALILLDVPAAKVRTALQRASQWQTALAGSADEAQGTYCCGRCSVALWRHLTVGGFADLDAERWLKTAMKTLRAARLDDGKWRRFPFYYTVLALSEIDLPAARQERKYAAPRCEALLKRGPKDDRIDARRRQLAERILAVC